MSVVRIGYLVTPTLLSFFDGGYTQTYFDQVNLSWAGTPGSLSPTGPTGFNIPATNYSGWFLGGGVEYALAWLPIPGLFWRSEYRFAEYQAEDLPYLVNATGAVVGGCLAPPAPGCGVHTQKYVQTATTSLVWRFNWFGR